MTPLINYLDKLYNVLRETDLLLVDKNYHERLERLTLSLRDDYEIEIIEMHLSGLDGMSHHTLFTRHTTFSIPKNSKVVKEIETLLEEEEFHGLVLGNVINILFVYMNKCLMLRDSEIALDLETLLTGIKDRSLANTYCHNLFKEKK